MARLIFKEVLNRFYWKVYFTGRSLGVLIRGDEPEYESFWQKNGAYCIDFL